MSDPSTPPSAAKTAPKNRDIPRFSLPDELSEFQTPRAKNPLQKAPFLTPKSAKNAASVLQTPASVRTSIFDTPNHTQRSPETPFTAPGTLAKNKQLLTKTPSTSLQLTPEQTPAKSPRASKRRRLNLDDFFQTSTDSISSLLLPNHSVVGSGRKAPKNSTLKAPISLDFSELAKLNENLAFEEDDVKVSSQLLPLAKNVPGTPEKQVLSDVQVAEWYGKSYRGQFSDDESDPESAPMENPFVAQNAANNPRKNTGNPFNSKPSVNYDTHLELINHRTGERRVELLTESQRKHKPKKLDFSNV